MRYFACLEFARFPRFVGLAGAATAVPDDRSCSSRSPSTARTDTGTKESLRVILSPSNSPPDKDTGAAEAGPPSSIMVRGDSVAATRRRPLLAGDVRPSLTLCALLRSLLLSRENISSSRNEFAGLSTIAAAPRTAGDK